jgi:hypothetical protein
MALESNGLVEVKQTKKHSIIAKTINLSVQPDEVKRACADNQVLLRVLENGPLALK